LDPKVKKRKGPPKEIRCYFRGCDKYLRPPTRSDSGVACPKHDIFCHSSGTYSYLAPEQNAIVSEDVFKNSVLGKSKKYDKKRLGNENSEDALTWNVFRSLQLAGCLGQCAQRLFGVPTATEPDLYLWGLRSTGDSFKLWDLLSRAREHFEGRLPPRHPRTEPDVALHVPCEYLLLIEAKFTSDNSCCCAHAGEKHGKLLQLYHSPTLNMLDVEKARSTWHLFDQLWRNMVFAEWMAQQDTEATEAYLVNLVREGYETTTRAEFGGLLNDEYQGHFRRVTWEEIYRLAMNERSELDLMCRYMEQKTANLRRAFDFGKSG